MQVYNILVYMYIKNLTLKNFNSWKTTVLSSLRSQCNPWPNARKNKHLETLYSPLHSFRQKTSQAISGILTKAKSAARSNGETPTGITLQGEGQIQKSFLVNKKENQKKFLQLQSVVFS